MDAPIFSVRMRATLHGRHLAGAERIVPLSDVSQVASDLISRVFTGTDVVADDVYCHVERIDPDTVFHARLPDVSTWQVSDYQEGRALAAQLLSRAGVDPDVASRSVQLLAEGAGPGGTVMRGAAIMDAATGVRLESDPSRGVRASRMDVAVECRRDFEAMLHRAGLGHRRVLEALVLAGKVISAPGIVAELCWSDDPEYPAGYVVDPDHGYQRISALKPVGDPHGGRIFFVKPGTLSIIELTNYLERHPVMFDSLGKINPAARWEPGHG
jgi:6-carboxyhexanoate--CoA ligase